MKYWEIIADKLSKAGWSWGCFSAIDSNGRQAHGIWRYASACVWPTKLIFTFSPPTQSKCNWIRTRYFLLSLHAQTLHAAAQIPTHYKCLFQSQPSPSLLPISDSIALNRFDSSQPYSQPIRWMSYNQAFETMTIAWALEMRRGKACGTSLAGAHMPNCPGNSVEMKNPALGPRLPRRTYKRAASL